VALIATGFYLLTASGHLLGQDEEYYYRMARSVARDHSFTIEPLVFRNTEIAGARGVDGRFYAEYAPGLPVALAPLVLLGDAINALPSDLVSKYVWLREGARDIAPRIAVSYFNIPVIGLSTALLILIIIRLGFSSYAAGFVGASFAVSTFAWGQARMIYPEPLQTLFILAAWLLMSRGSTKAALVAGFALGCGILVKLTTVLALPALLLLPDERATVVWRPPWRIIAIVLPLVGALGVYAWYNYSRFGSFIATGYSTSGTVAELGGNGIGNPMTGLYGLLFSTGRGVIWYAPLVIVAVASARRFYHERKGTAVAVFVFLAAWLAVHSCYKGWDSGWGWGPRYLLPVLPVALLPLASSASSFAGRLARVGLFAAGVVVQLPGALADFMASGQQGMAVFGQTAAQRTQEIFVAWRNFNVAGSEIVQHSALLLRGQLDVAWLTFRNSWLTTMTFGLVTLLVGTGFVLLLWPRLRDACKSKNLVGTTP